VIPVKHGNGSGSAIFAGKHQHIGGVKQELRHESIAGPGNPRDRI